MKRKKRGACLMGAVCLTVMLLCGLSVTASAADTADLDLTQKGTISLTLYSDESGMTVADGALTIYEVADLTLKNGDMAYEMTEAFSGFCGFPGDDDDEYDLAAALADYVTENGVNGNVQEIALDGSVKFSNLKLGLYLIVQSTESTGYYAVGSFLVTVPLDEGGMWAYSVEASPKVQVYPEAATPPPAEIPPEKATPDKTAPTLIPAPTISPGSKLPQTGQLVWPIAVLAVFGAVFFLGGCAVKKNSGV